MKKILSVLFILSILPLKAVALSEVSLGNVAKEKIDISKSPKVVKGSLLISDDEMLDELIKLQKQKDLEDIEMIWKGTVQNNKVIEFALKKLSTPESQRRIHSSLMAKTLSAVISGGSFAPMFMGADPTVRTGAFAVGRIAQTLINKKTTPQEVPLTDTELIELAGLVEDLQDKIISAYYNYKSSLNQLKETRSRLILYNKNYNKALDTGDILDISVSSSLYDNMMLEEYQYMQLATKYHLELQRLAGKKTVEKLNLYQYNFNAALFKTNGGNSKKNFAVKKVENKAVSATKSTNWVKPDVAKKQEKSKKEKIREKKNTSKQAGTKEAPKTEKIRSFTPLSKVLNNDKTAPTSQIKQPKPEKKNWLKGAIKADKKEKKGEKP